MKVLCESCERLAPPSSWSVGEDGLRLVCGACGHAHVLSGATGPRPPPAPRTPPPRPPPAPAPAPAGSGWLDRGWADLREKWSDPAAHERLIAAAAAQNGLQELGRRYREALEASPRDERALAARDALIRRATQELVIRMPAQQAGAPTGARRVRSLFFAFLTLLLVAFAAFLLLRGGALPTPP